MAEKETKQTEKADDKARTQRPDVGERNLVERIFSGDRSLWITVSFLLVASVMLIFSVTAYHPGVAILHPVAMQILYVVIGLTALWTVHKVNYQHYRGWAVALFIVSVILVLMLPVIGEKIAGSDMRRSIRIPLIGLTFMPSDILKLSLVVILSGQLAVRQKVIDRIRILPSINPLRWRDAREENMRILTAHTIPIFLPILVACALTIYFVGLSTTVIIFTTCFIMLFIGRVRLSELGRLTAIVVIPAALVVSIMILFGIGNGPTWSARISNFSRQVSSSDRMANIAYKNIQPKDTILYSHFYAIACKTFEVDNRLVTKDIADLSPMEQTLPSRDTNIYRVAYYDNPSERDTLDIRNQPRNAKVAIASGGILGKGPGMSTQRTQLTSAENDYAYAFFIEEYGAVGGIVVLMLYFWIFVRSIVIFRRCGTAFPSLLVLGLSVMILFQAIFHMLVSVSIFPVTGQPLPFISRGGSSLVFMLVAVGIILGVSRQTEENSLDRPKDESILEK